MIMVDQVAKMVNWMPIEVTKPRSVPPQLPKPKPKPKSKMERTSKVNWGYIQEFPDITVNLFNPGNAEWNTARAFFLTHVDDVELLESVLNVNFLRLLNEGESQTHRLYLHEISYSFLIYWATSHERFFPNITGLLEHLKRTGRIICLKKNIPIRLNFVKPGISSCPLEITPLSAGSSPGSIMLLIEQIGGVGRVLYTGNCRVIIKDLKYCQPLYDVYGKLKKITRLYIDTTFCTQQIEELPVRRAVIDEALEDATDKVHKDPTVKIQIKAKFPLDGLHFLRCMYEETKEKVHMSEDFYNKFVKGIAALAPVATTASGLQTLFHFHYGCDMRKDSDCGGTAGDEMFDIQLLGSITDLPLEEKEKTYTNFYSAHLSRYEMARVINFLQIPPKFVCPIYLPPGMHLQDVEILIHLSCLTVEDEPEELGLDYPSQFHDFTGCSTLFNRDYYKIPRPYFLHRDCPPNFIPQLNHFYVKRAPFFPIDNFQFEEFEQLGHI